MKTWELQPKPEFESLTLVDRPSAEVGPLDVKVRVRAVSLNYRDLGQARNAVKRKAPIVPVSDGAGEVLAVGAAVKRVKPGDQVCASFFPHWLDGELSDAHHAAALGGGGDGMLREEVVLPEHSWVKVPEGWSFEEAATLPCAGVTAWQALFERGGLRAGETVLLQGSGGVSVFALQLAKAAGARVIITSSQEHKRARLRELGADEVLDYVKEPKWGERAKALTQGRGVDLVVDVGGPGTFDQSTAALRYGGSMSILGVLTGTRGEVNTYAIFHRRLRVNGIYVGSVTMFEALVRALNETKLRPVIDRVFGFSEAKPAYEYLASGKHLGKVVMRVD